MNLDRFRKACDRAWFNLKNAPKWLTWVVHYRYPIQSNAPTSSPTGMYKPISVPSVAGSPFPFIVSDNLARYPEPTMPTNDSNTYFKLFQSKKNKQWYFSIYGGNHRIIAQSEGYKRKESAEKAIATLKRETAAATVKE